MSEDTNTPTSETPATENKPQSLQELIANIDITNVSTHEIVVDLISGIQQLAIRAQIALGLLERLNIESNAIAAEAEVAPETSETSSATPEQA